MSKKYKRQVRKEKAASSSAATPDAGTSRTQSASVPAFNPDYTYIIKDLRRIGVIAASFIGILVVLSFILK
jgi:hypothetical protein